MAAIPLISASELSKTFGVKPLFTGITFAVDQSESIALIGPNGSGKSTLLKMLAGLEHPDDGQVRTRSGLRKSYVPQEDRFDGKLTVAETMEAALVAAGYDAHEVDGKIEIMCGKAGFADKHSKVSELSGGWKKRLAICRGLIVEPELLLLDEPTNHLDINGILWLEAILSKTPAALLFVSHDRYFIEKLARRVIEINRQYPRGFFSSPGGYVDFLESREAHLEGLKQNRDALANRVRREVDWLRQGAKARTTKSKYRIERAGRMQDELGSYNLEERKVSLEFAASNKKSKDLIKIEHVSKEFGGKTLFKDVTFTLSPGIRLGIVGPNGSGKTTFLKILLDQLKPDKGSVTLARNLKVSFFDQTRAQLDRNITLKEALCPEGDGVVFNGRQIHIVGWAERFLFSREHLSLPISSLSGGEQARALLAKIMLEQTDVLLFDEPTNDLDIKTLEILEESFIDYPGAIVLITHDRYLLDRASTVVLGLGPAQGALFGSYSQWEATLKNSKHSDGSEKEVQLKLSQSEKRELETIEKDIVKAEKQVEKLQEEISTDKISGDPAALSDCCDKLAALQERVENLYNRWEELESIKKKAKGAKANLN